MIQAKEQSSSKINIEILEVEKGKLENKLKNLNDENIRKNRELEDLANQLRRKSQALNTQLDLDNEKELL